MADNLRIWNAVCKTDPKHTKQFTRAGGFKGTATKPIWQTMRLTEFFGPAGVGWGMGAPEFQTVAAGEEILVFCTVSLWYRDGEALGTVYGVGGDKVVTKRQSGSFTNDEAFKAAYTDALSNAMKQIGVSADIHMGLFEDQKYLREVKEEFANSDAPPAEQTKPAPAAKPIPRQSSAHGRALAAEEPELVANAGGRLKGTMSAATTQAAFGRAPTVEEARAAKIAAGTNKRVDALKSRNDWTRPELDQFWQDNSEWIAWMADADNKALAEYQRFTDAFAYAEVNMKEVA